jgi:hypothetical protein
MIHFAADHGLKFGTGAVGGDPIPATAPGMVAA